MGKQGSRLIGFLAVLVIASVSLAAVAQSAPPPFIEEPVAAPATASQDPCTSDPTCSAALKQCRADLAQAGKDLSECKTKLGDAVKKIAEPAPPPTTKCVDVVRKDDGTVEEVTSTAKGLESCKCSDDKFVAVVVKTRAAMVCVPRARAYMALEAEHQKLSARYDKLTAGLPEGFVLADHVKKVGEDIARLQRDLQDLGALTSNLWIVILRIDGELRALAPVVAAMKALAPEIRESPNATLEERAVKAKKKYEDRGAPFRVSVGAEGEVSHRGDAGVGAGTKLVVRGEFFPDDDALAGILLEFAPVAHFDPDTAPVAVAIEGAIGTVLCPVGRAKECKLAVDIAVMARQYWDAAHPDGYQDHGQSRGTMGGGKLGVRYHPHPNLSLGCSLAVGGGPVNRQAGPNDLRQGSGFQALFSCGVGGSVGLGKYSDD